MNFFPQWRVKSRVSGLGWNAFPFLVFLFFFIECKAAVLGQDLPARSDPLKQLIRQIDVPGTSGGSWYLSIQDGVETDLNQAIGPQKNNGFGDISFSNGNGPVYIKRGKSLYIGSPNHVQEFEKNWLENERSKNDALKNSRSDSEVSPAPLPPGIDQKLPEKNENGGVSGPDFKVPVEPPEPPIDDEEPSPEQ